MYFVKRAFSPLLITTAGAKSNNSVQISLISDIPQDLQSCLVTAELWRFNATSSPDAVWNTTTSKVVAMGVAINVLHIPNLKQPDQDRFLYLKAICTLAGNETVIAEKEHFLQTNFSAFTITKGGIVTSSWSQRGNECSFIVTSLAVEIFVVLEARSMKGRFSDSSFVLLPNVPKPLSFTAPRDTTCNSTLLHTSLTISSLHTLV